MKVTRIVGYVAGAFLMVTPAIASAHNTGFQHQHVNQNSNNGNQLLGAGIGAVAGGVLGSQLAGTGARTEGSVLGAVIGGVAGAAIAGNGNNSQQRARVQSGQVYNQQGGYVGQQNVGYTANGHQPTYRTSYSSAPVRTTYVSQPVYAAPVVYRSPYYSTPYYGGGSSVNISIGSGRSFIGNRGFSNRRFISNRRGIGFNRGVTRIGFNSGFNSRRSFGSNRRFNSRRSFGSSRRFNSRRSFGGRRSFRRGR